MPNIAKVFKDEIARIARKEAKQAVAPFRKPTSAARRTFADLKRRVVALEKENKRLSAELSQVPRPDPLEASAKAKGWISGRGVRSLRLKLGLTQEAFARLVGVSSNAVYQWERKSGMLHLRGNTRAAVMATRKLGARDAKARLAEMKPVRKAKPAGRRGRRKAKK